MEFYVYSTEDKEHIATITGSSNAAIEKTFLDRFDMNGDYGGTYSPAFGCNDGLVENSDAEEIDADAHTITYKGQEYDVGAARALMDDNLVDEIHGTVETEQEFFDAYVKAHEDKFGEEFVVN